MAEKISTLIIKVDLDCCQCYKKIRKTLCSLQDRENIRTISYDEKNNTVTVSGPFDPKKLSKKLYCKATCKVIKDIQIVEPPKEKEKEKPKEVPTEKLKVTFIEPVKEKEKPKEAQPVKEKEKEKEKEKPKDTKPAEPAKPAKEKVNETAKVVVVETVKEKEKPPAAAEPAKPVHKHQAGMVQLPGPAYPQMPGPGYQQCWPVGPVCNCGPWYEAHYGGTRCCACGRSYGWVSEGPPTDGNRTCHFFADEDPGSTCNIM